MNQLNRRDFLKATAAVGLTGLAGGQALGDGTPAKPNIVILLCDQMVIDGISAYRNYFQHEAYFSHWLKTPNLDRMAQNGYSFMKSYTAYPVCSPDRASIFTGRPPTENGVITNNIGIALNVPNMGEWFSAAGYRSIYCGKWHAGGAWNSPNVSGSRKIPGFETMPVCGSGAGVDMDPQIAASIGAFIRNYSDPEPFLIAAGFLHPHDICYWHGGSKHNMKSNDYGLELPPMPPNFAVDHSGTWANTNIKSHPELTWRLFGYDYCRQIEMLDTEIGKVLDAVDSRPDAASTIVIFTSDHGEAAGRMSSVGKGDAFQYACHVPLIFYCPGRISPNVQDDTHLASALDIMPTVCEFAGIAPPPLMRGYSLKDIVEGNPPPTWRSFIYGEYAFTAKMIFDGQYKYAFKYNYTGNVDLPYRLASNGSATKWQVGQEHLHQQDAGSGLFDLVNDPWEMTNLSGNPAYASIQADLDSQLRNFMNTLQQNDHYDRN